MICNIALFLCEFTYIFPPLAATCKKIPGSIHETRDLQIGSRITYSAIGRTYFSHHIVHYGIQVHLLVPLPSQFTLANGDPRVTRSQTKTRVGPGILKKIWAISSLPYQNLIKDNVEHVNGFLPVLICKFSLLNARYVAIEHRIIIDFAPVIHPFYLFDSFSSFLFPLDCSCFYHRPSYSPTKFATGVFLNNLLLIPRTKRSKHRICWAYPGHNPKTSSKCQKMN